MSYPEIDLSYLRVMTDSAGIIQHATHSVPNRHLGYTTDDNARALIVATRQFERTGDRADLDLVVTYLSYLHHSQSPDHRFRNIMEYNRSFIDEEGTEDCYGRAMWACGVVASSKVSENIRIVASNIFRDSIGWVGDLDSPRAKAYCILGMSNYLHQNENKLGLIEKIDALADSLVVGLNTYGDKKWRWYEPYLTYGNAIMPLGMLVAAELLGRKLYRQVAVETIQFLTETLFRDGYLDIIGNNGWYLRGGRRAVYDQQSIDAGYTVLLYTEAYKRLGDKQYYELAHTAYSWFFGNNISGVWVYDPVTKGCYDAITPQGVNLNQGAEACICFLLAQLAIAELDKPA